MKIFTYKKEKHVCQLESFVAGGNESERGIYKCTCGKRWEEMEDCNSVNNKPQENTMNKKSQLLWMSYPDEKLKIAQKRGYKTYYDMLIGEYEKGYSPRDISKYAEMTYAQILKILIALGADIKPPGGRNNAVIPQWGVEELRTYPKMTNKIAEQYACIFLCGKKTVYDNWRRNRNGNPVIRGSVQQQAEFNRGKYLPNGEEA